jgi:hypothetical protein
MYKLIKHHTGCDTVHSLLASHIHRAIEAIASRVRLQKTDRLSGMDHLDLDRVWAHLLTREADLG